MRDAEVDFVLERFDQTEPTLQRKIVAGLIERTMKTQEQRDLLLAACEGLLACSLPKDVSGQRMVQNAVDAIASVKAGEA